MHEAGRGQRERAQLARRTRSGCGPLERRAQPAGPGAQQALRKYTAAQVQAEYKAAPTAAELVQKGLRSEDAVYA